MPDRTLQLNEVVARKLDEIAALDGESGQQLIDRLLPRWLDEYRALWEYIEVGRRDSREGRLQEHDDFFDELEAELQAASTTEQVAAE